MTATRQYIQQVFKKDMENSLSKDISSRLESRLLREKKLLRELCKRPSTGLTEVRRDGKDNDAIAKVITKEFYRCINIMSQHDFVNHMHVYTYGCWVRSIISFVKLRRLHHCWYLFQSKYQSYVCF